MTEEASLCRNKLHERPAGIRTCRPCKRAANRRYDTSPKGRAAHLDAYRRYNYSTKGLLNRLRAETKAAGV